jgi:hypothetical protein
MSEYPPPIILKTNNAPVIINYEDFVPTPVKKYDNIIINDSEIDDNYCDLSLICYSKNSKDISKSILLEKFFSTIKVDDILYNINNNYTNITYYNSDFFLDNISFSSVTNNKKFEISDNILDVSSIYFDKKTIEYYDHDIHREGRIINNFNIPNLIKSIIVTDETFKMRFFNNMIFFRKLPIDLKELLESDLNFYKRTIISKSPSNLISEKLDLTDISYENNDNSSLSLKCITINNDDVKFKINENNILSINMLHDDSQKRTITFILQYRNDKKGTENNDYKIIINSEYKTIDEETSLIEHLDNIYCPNLNTNITKFIDSEFQNLEPNNIIKNTLNYNTYIDIEEFEHFKIYYYYNEPYKIYINNNNKKYIKILEYIVIEFEDNFKIKILNSDKAYNNNKIYIKFIEKINNTEYNNNIILDKLTMGNMNNKYDFTSTRTYYEEKIEQVDIENEDLLKYIYEKYFITYSLIYKTPTIDCKNTILNTIYDNYNNTDFEVKEKEEDDEDNSKYEINKKNPRELKYEIYVTLCFKDEHSKFHKSIFDNHNNILNDDDTVFDDFMYNEAEDEDATKIYNEYLIKFIIDIPYFIYNVNVTKLSSTLNTTSSSTTSSSSKTTKKTETEDNRLIVKYAIDIKTSNFVYSNISNNKGFYNEILRRYVTYESRLVDIRSSSSTEGNTKVVYENGIEDIIDLIIKNQKNYNSSLSKEFIAKWLMTNTHYCPQSNCMNTITK